MMIEYLTYTRSKIHEQIFGVQISAKQAKIGPEIRLLANFSSILHYFSFKLYSLELCLTTSRGKTQEKTLEAED